MKSMFGNTSAIIMLQDGSVGLVTTATVPSLMKGVWYNTTTANLATDILVVGCECKCGSTTVEVAAAECVVCVHNPVNCYKVTQLMHEGLAEHILIKLTSGLAGFPS